jgi:hypothetical protein
MCQFRQLRQLRQHRQRRRQHQHRDGRDDAPLLVSTAGDKPFLTHDFFETLPPPIGHYMGRPCAALACTTLTQYARLSPKDLEIEMTEAGMPPHQWSAVHQALDALR